MLYRFARRLFFIYYLLLYRVRVEGRENIPSQGPVILCANHISMHDPMLLGAFIRRPVHFLAKSELFGNPLTNRIMRSLNAMPVVRASPGMSSFKSAMAVLGSGRVLGIFAQGRRVSLKEYDDGSIKAGVALFALKSGAEVIPIKITPRYRVFLPLTIKIGAPVDLSAFRPQKTRSDMLNQAAEVIYNRVKEM